MQFVLETINLIIRKVICDGTVQKIIGNNLMSVFAVFIE